MGNTLDSGDLWDSLKVMQQEDNIKQLLFKGLRLCL